MKKTLKRIRLLSLSKYLKIGMLLTAFLFLFKNSIISQNLILNGSFEQYNSLSCNGAEFDVTNWNVLRSPDYFTSQCSIISGGGIPQNMFGCSYPKNGNAYAGLGTINYPYENKEYVYQHLVNPLIAGKSYYTSFFLSKSDRTRIATEKIGVYFSVSPPVAPSNTYVNAVPQVENHSGFLTDTVNWVKIEGYFTAQGGEQYITIGNFNSNADTDTLYTGTTNPFFADAGSAYYYIDSVSLYDSLDYVTNIRKYEEEFKVKVFPNPSDGKFSIEYSLHKIPDAEMRIFDITGKLIGAYRLGEATSKIEINEFDLKNGVYFYNLYVNGTIGKTNRIIIIK